MLTLMLFTNLIMADTAVVRKISVANGFAPSKRIVKAISAASKAYNIPVTKMTAIAITETGIGSNVKTRLNNNKTLDHGLFQLNSVNLHKCPEYNIESYEGNALCAAKLLSKLRKNRPNDYWGAFHSKTPSLKTKYMLKIEKVLENAK